MNTEERNIKITRDKAKEWYNGNSAELREIALQAYTEEELKTLELTDIKTFWDAAKALGLPGNSVRDDLHNLEVLPFEASMKKHLAAVYKLGIIRKALNKDWNPSLVKGSVYYPYVRFYPAGQKAREAASSNNWKLGESFKADGQKYTLVGGGYSCYGCDGLAVFGCGSGGVCPHLGLLGCKSREIAEHMSRYFSKEIFEATYAQHTGTYRWV